MRKAISRSLRLAAINGSELKIASIFRSNICNCRFEIIVPEAQVSGAELAEFVSRVGEVMKNESPSSISA